MFVGSVNAFLLGPPMGQAYLESYPPKLGFTKFWSLTHQNLESPNFEGRQAWETRRQAAAKSRQREPRAAQNGNHEGRQAWETRRQRQPRAAQKGNHEGRPCWETRHGSGSQEQPRREIMKGDNPEAPKVSN